MPILTGRQQIAIKSEATAGTAETLAAANVVLTTGAAEWSPEVAMTPRSAMTASLSPRGSVVGSQSAKISFKMFIRPNFTSGTAVTTTATEGDFSVPLKGCGVTVAYSAGGGSPNEFATYTPSSSHVVDETSGVYSTVALYEDGKVYKIHGAVGNCVLTFNVGQPVLAEFEFTGCFNAPIDGALLVPTYSNVVEPAFLSAALSVFGSGGAYTAAKISSLKFDLGNTIAMRPYPNTATGFFTAQITGRNPKGSFDPEEALAATFNPFAAWIAGTTGGITTGVFPSTGTNYSTMNFTVAKASYTKVGLADRDGVASAPVEFEAQATLAAGEDEWSLVCT